MALRELARIYKHRTAASIAAEQSLHLKAFEHGEMRLSPRIVFRLGVPIHGATVL
jgi:hypothetical protein